MTPARITNKVFSSMPLKRPLEMVTCFKVRWRYWMCPLSWRYLPLSCHTYTHIHAHTSSVWRERPLCQHSKKFLLLFPPSTTQTHLPLSLPYPLLPLQCPKSFRAQQMGLVGTQQQIAANVGVKWLSFKNPHISVQLISVWLFTFL